MRRITDPSMRGSCQRRANLALRDAAELGEAIAAHPRDVESALTAYEQALFPRSHEHAVAAAYKPTADDMIAFFTR